MARRSPNVWLVAAAGVLAGALIGAGAAYALQQGRVSEAESRLTALRDTIRRTEAEKDAALERVAELTKAAEEPTMPAEPEPVEPQPSDSPATPLPKSTFTFVEKLTFGRPGTIVLDYAEYLTGKKAADAAKARGDESPPPNDYYIVNENTKLRTFKIAPNAKVRLVSNPDGTSDPAGYEATVEQWAGYFAAPSDENAAIRAAGYWVVVENGTVTAVREQFVP